MNNTKFEQFKMIRANMDENDVLVYLPFLPGNTVRSVLTEVFSKAADAIVQLAKVDSPLPDDVVTDRLTSAISITSEFLSSALMSSIMQKMPTIPGVERHIVIADCVQPAQYAEDGIEAFLTGLLTSLRISGVVCAFNSPNLPGVIVATPTDTTDALQQRLAPILEYFETEIEYQDTELTGIGAGLILRSMFGVTYVETAFGAYADNHPDMAQKVLSLRLDDPKTWPLGQMLFYRKDDTSEHVLLSCINGKVYENNPWLIEELQNQKDVPEIDLSAFLADHDSVFALRWEA
jgi:hypothetical protein